MAGAGYKLFNTGDVLTAAQVNTYLMEQTVMVFADAAARTAALTGVVSEGMLSYLKSTKQVEVYNGSAWVASDDPNAIQNTIVDAKGDLITATASDVPARLAVGNNGETLVADSSATTGLRYQTSVNGNSVINGGMDIWQRGTSAAGGYPTYLADRWMNYRSVAGSTFSRQNTNDTTNLPQIQYSQRIARDSGNTSTAGIYISQSLESEESRKFIGQTVVLSWYARAGANFSAASSNMTFELVYGTGTNQNVIAGFTGQTIVTSGTKTLTTTWQRFSATATVNAAATQLGINLYFIPVGTAGANDWMEITGVQLELGSVPTAFKRAGGTLAGELAAARRYYVRFGAHDGIVTSAYSEYGYANSTTTTNLRAGINLQQRMRVAPTAVEWGNLTSFELNNTERAVSAVVIQSVTNSDTVGSIDITVATTTNSAMHRLTNGNNTGGYLAFTAEL